jgi:hypothetical protein
MVKLTISPTPKASFLKVYPLSGSKIEKYFRICKGEKLHGISWKEIEQNK